MHNVQILFTLQNVKSFLGVFTRSGSIIFNADPHMVRVSHWLAIHFEPRSPLPTISTYKISSPLFPLAKHSWDITAPSGITTRYNYRAWPAQSVPNTAVCSPCTWTEVIPQYNSSAFSLLTLQTDKKDEIFTSEFGPLRKEPRSVRCSYNIYKRYVPNRKSIILNFYIDWNGGSYRLRIPEWELRWSHHKETCYSGWKYHPQFTFSESVRHVSSQLHLKNTQLGWWPHSLETVRNRLSEAVTRELWRFKM